MSIQLIIIIAYFAVSVLVGILMSRGTNTSSKFHGAHLAVALGNKSAIRAYEKTGFITEYDRKFARVVKINMPYHAL